MSQTSNDQALKDKVDALAVAVGQDVSNQEERLSALEENGAPLEIVERLATVELTANNAVSAASGAQSTANAANSTANTAKNMAQTLQDTAVPQIEERVETLETSTVKTSGNQTIAGIKTFSSTITGSVSGNAGTADKLKTARTVSLTGDVTGSGNFSGDANLVIKTTLSSSGIPSGTQMLFAQSAAPTGWTKQTTVNDAAIRVVSGTTGGTASGTTAFSTMFNSSFSLSISGGNTGATTLTVAQMPSHTHNISSMDFNAGTGSSARPLVRSNFNVNANTSPNPQPASMGSSSSHTHSLSGGSATVNLAVKYLDVIVCKKN